MDAVVPETVQTGGVVEAKLTANPELAEAESVRLVPAVWPAMVGKLMVWGAVPVTKKLCWTIGAAA